MTERIALITGATSGVGRVVAKRLAREGWLVLVHGRDEVRGAEVVGEIEADGGRARFYGADLSSKHGVRTLAEEVAKDHPRLPLLINNAGIGFGPPGAGREVSSDGYELRFAVNCLAPFLLTRLLLPNVLAAAPARIVNVASIGQQDLDFDDLQFKRGYSGVDAYRRSKLALIMLTFDLAEELKDRGLTVNALHPATLMDTFMVRQARRAPMSTVDEGADAIMNLAVSDEMSERSGEYFDGLNPARARAQAYDRRSRERLRQISFELTGAP
ncbi:MAG TPA: SDR family NAD(P)-dependent oxidoreductase [Dongiaceae bacterium]|jgi:NAD(P)-dependent dehydrogenase (short-subunit alcohol dehydrogenase family)|nr:SDR family NAD(P)-dependent oxidoreductase [Dongiaceae bacterium]